jgi:cell division protein ZapE
MTPPKGVLERYRALIATHELRPDPEQAGAAERLDRLQQELEATPVKTGFLGRLMGKKPALARGLYIWGGVGRGKSMLMDLFHDALAIPEKRRVHFHAFMQEVHAIMRDVRKGETGDPIPQVAARIASGLRVLAFDEMVVNNSADAMIMSRLFTALIHEHHLTLVTTSNRAPSELYKNGLNREHFLPFIALIESELEVMTLNGPVDYRLERLAGTQSWHMPLGHAATERVREVFFRLTDFPPEDARHVPSAELDVGGGRTLHVPKSLKGVAVFSFKKLCGEARGVSDYLAVARAYHTVIIVGLPRLSAENRNEATRFMTLIDALYEHKVKLFVTADASPERLYNNDNRENDTGAFEFDRTVSRLTEMQSKDYLAKGHGEE